MESPALEPGFLFEWHLDSVDITAGGEIVAAFRFLQLYPRNGPLRMPIDSFCIGSLESFKESDSVGFCFSVSFFLQK